MTAAIGATRNLVRPLALTSASTPTTLAKTSTRMATVAPTRPITEAAVGQAATRQALTSQAEASRHTIIQTADRWGTAGPTTRNTQMEAVARIALTAPPPTLLRGLTLASVEGISTTLTATAGHTQRELTDAHYHYESLWS